MADFLDVSVWVALSFPNHSHHARAIEYWHTEASPHVVFCRTTALALARVGSNTMFGPNFVSPQSAWNIFLKWRAHPGVSLLTDPHDVDLHLSLWTDQGIVTKKNWTDAYLAAFALSSGLRLVSFDNDFHAFPGLQLLHLRG